MTVLAANNFPKRIVRAVVASDSVLSTKILQPIMPNPGCLRKGWIGRSRIQFGRNRILAGVADIMTRVTEVTTADVVDIVLI